MRTRTTRRRNSGLVDAGGEHTQALGHSGEAVRGRRSRVVLTPGVCASQKCTRGGSRVGRTPGLPCAAGFNGVLRALPGERCTIAPVASPLVRCTHPVGHHASPRDLTPATGRQDHTTSPSADGQPGSVKGWRVLTPDVQPGRCDRAVSYRVAHDSTGCPSLSSHFRAGATASTAPRPASRDDREAPLWQGPG